MKKFYILVKGKKVAEIYGENENSVIKNEIDISVILFIIMSLLGIYHMLYKDFFEGFVIMTLSLIISKQIIEEIK